MIEDVDGNDQFTTGDQLTWYRYRIGEKGPAEPLVDPFAIDKATSILR